MRLFRTAFRSSTFIRRFSSGTSLPSQAGLKAIAEHFPGAMAYDMLATTSQNLLTPHGFTRDNSLFGTSTCPDEINRMGDILESVWGPSFPLGGLGGLPFTGKTGFGAFASHAPDDGRIVVMFGPHIGISDKGNLGKVVRPGMSDESTSCGACVGAFSLRDTPPPDMAMGDEPIGDYQMNVVRQIVAGKASAIEKADEHDFAALNNEFYASVKAELLKVIPDDLQFPIALIGGIQINTDVPHTDFFLPKDVMFRKGPGDEFADLSKDFESLMAPARKDEGKGHLYIQQ